MSEYDVVLIDRDGCDICADLIDGLVAAKARARYLLSDDHAKQIGTTHDTLGTYTAGAMGTAAPLPFLLSPNYPDGLFFGQRYDSIVNIGGLVVWACAAVLFVILVTTLLFFRTSPKPEAIN